jgi:hypothetical protein
VIKVSAEPEGLLLCWARSLDFGELDEEPVGINSLAEAKRVRWWDFGEDSTAVVDRGAFGDGGTEELRVNPGRIKERIFGDVGADAESIADEAGRLYLYTGFRGAVKYECSTSPFGASPN